MQGKDARNPPSFQNQLEALDDAERKQEGGIPHWESHAGHYAWANKHLHPSVYVALSLTGDDSEFGGFKALAYGFQYFGLGSDAVLRLVGLEEDRLEFLERYTAVQPLREAELEQFRDRAAESAKVVDP